MRRKKNKKGSRDHAGVAAFLDLHDSTFAWNLNADLAERVVLDLDKVVRGRVRTCGGSVGNFTGDGFLLLFEEAEQCVNCLAAIIREWDIRRKRHIAAYRSEGSTIPDDLFLDLRTGVCFGFYRDLRGLNGKHVAGSAINMAQRCEAEGKKHFKTLVKDLFPDQPRNLEQTHRIFVHQNVHSLLARKTGFFRSGQLEAQFRGVTVASLSGSQSGEVLEKQYLFAVWPKHTPVKKGEKPPTAKELQRLEVMAVADRNAAVGNQLYEMSISSAWGSRSEALDKALSSLSDAVNLYRKLGYDALVASAQNNIGVVLGTQAALISGEERRTKLEESARAFRAALRVRTIESVPDQYAMTQNNLGNVLGLLAGSLSNDERKTMLEDAVHAFREALRVSTLESAPSRYATTQTNLGIVLKDKAELFSGVERRARLGEAVDAYREALRVLTFESMPRQYAVTQNNLGVALTREAALASSEEREMKLRDAIGALREALRVRTFESAPSQYATTQNNLGNALLLQIERLTGVERMERSKEAVDAYQEALRVHTFGSAPVDFAMTQNNLGNALGKQADLLSGEERKAKLEEAVGAYREALRVYTKEHYFERHTRIAHEVERIEKLLQS